MAKTHMKKPSEKGGEWERAVGKQISLWLTGGERDDLFRRNVLSGGQFTQAANRGLARGRSGDVVDNHPLAYQFSQRYSVECKHYRDLELPQFLLNTTSFLHTVIEKHRSQAKVEGKHWLVIAKQNSRPPFVLFPEEAFPVGSFTNLPHHKMFLCNEICEPVYMVHLTTFFKMDPKPFLKPLERAQIHGTERATDSGLAPNR